MFAQPFQILRNIQKNAIKLKSESKCGEQVTNFINKKIKIKQYNSQYWVMCNIGKMQLNFKQDSDWKSFKGPKTKPKHELCGLEDFS